MPLVMDADITQLKGADYNPRKSDDASISKLCESIRKLGLVKPLIARDKTLVAGHQRTKALRKIGATTAPVYFLESDASLYDEIRFNQLHNGTDMDLGDENCRITTPLPKLGYNVVESQHVTGNLKSQGIVIRAEICSLITKYGPWGGVVATQSGKVIHCGQYALSSMLTHTPLTVYVIEDAREAEYTSFLSSQYGVFSYDNLKRDTYVQTFAQLCRLRETGNENGRQNISKLYESFAIPYIRSFPRVRVLDFGCGMGDYVARLQGEGVKIDGLEFFRRKKGRNQIDIAAVHKMIDTVIFNIQNHGPYDVVLMDSVLNSVDCIQAEQDVLNTIHILCKEDGILFFSGRTKATVDGLIRMNRNVSKKHQRQIQFLDKDNFTALYRQGSWFYQKFHSSEQIDEIINLRGWDEIKRSEAGSSWQCVVKRGPTVVPQQDIIGALSREFNMEYNSRGGRYGRHLDIINALKAYI